MDSALESTEPGNETQQQSDATKSVESVSLSDDALQQLTIVQEDISQIVLNGIQDTSILANPESISSVWTHLVKLHKSKGDVGVVDDFGVDAKTRSFIRAVCEGSRLSVSGLLPLLKDACDSCGLKLTLEKLATLVPIFLDRNNLGDAFSESETICKYDCNRPECLWRWESPSLDVFPEGLIESVRVAREIKHLNSNRYKTLKKLELAIKQQDQKAQFTLRRELNDTSRKLLQAREKSAALVQSKKPVAVKRKRDGADKKPTSAQPNMLLNWLKVSDVPSSSEGDVCATQQPFKSVNSKGGTSTPAATAFDLTDFAPNEDHRKDLSTLIDALPLKKHQQQHQDMTYEEFIKYCTGHREAWMQYFTFINTRRTFYVDKVDGEGVKKTVLVDNVAENLLDTSYGDVNLVANRHCNVFQMFDTQWKRPCMRLAISRSSNVVSPLNPTAVENALDYAIDSDDEWFMQYDADDVDASGGSDEEDDGLGGAGEEELNDFIVDDDKNDRENTNDPVSLGESVKVYCMYRNWHWIVDGVAQENNLVCSRTVAAENGMKIKGGDWGFGFEGFTRNPIPDFLKSLKGNKLIMCKDDIVELLLHCHGRHTKKDELIASFKETKPFCSASDIKRKFSKYIQRVKIDDSRHRWLVTSDAAKLFGIGRKLDCILNQLLV